MSNERFRCMDQIEANEQCGTRFQRYMAKCPACLFTVILHCRNCAVQITGCMCTAEERMEPEDFERFKQQMKGRR